MLVGIDLSARRCMKTCNRPRLTACHVTASFGKETAAPTVRSSVPAAVSGAPVQKGFSAMNFRILAASAGPRGRGFALLAATALTATLLAPGVHAQAPSPAPKAKAAP